MAGVVLETLSWKKLIILGVFLAIILLTSFLVGGLVAPNISNVMQILGTKCIIGKNDSFRDTWFIPYGKGHCENITSIESTDPEITKRQIKANMIVFAFHLPYIRKIQFRMSPWQQSIISVLSVDMKYDQHQQHERKDLKLRVKLGYRDHGDRYNNWKLIAKSDEDRELECNIDDDKKVEGMFYNCSILSLFELGSISHDYYLVNIMIPTDDLRGINLRLGKIVDIYLIAIHQNGGFTKVWLSFKCLVFPSVLFALVWFWRRIYQLSRPPNVLEKMLFALGLSLTILNAPIEFISIVADAPYMTLIGDIRQGLFYAFLMSFWIIFIGEHIMDDAASKSFLSYWKHLSAVAFGSICLFVFDMCERGVKLSNPFFSIWASKVGRNLALAFIILAGISACCYFLFLFYMIVRALKNIRTKRSLLPSMPSTRRLYYLGLVYRFQFLIVVTLVCAAATIVFFIVSQALDTHTRFDDDPQVQYTSGMFTGVYTMWNVYVFGLLSLYAPSHKQYTSNADTAEELTPIPTVSSETTHVDTNPLEMADLSRLLTKSAVE